MIYALAALATYYSALSITREDGPFELFLKLRNLFTSDGWLARGVRCLICVSAYAGAVWAAVLAARGHIGWADVPMIALGLAGASVTLDKYWRR